jgi:hypothetical protein
MAPANVGAGTYNALTGPAGPREPLQRRAARELPLAIVRASVGPTAGLVISATAPMPWPQPQMSFHAPLASLPKSILLWSDSRIDSVSLPATQITRAKWLPWAPINSVVQTISPSKPPPRGLVDVPAPDVAGDDEGPLVFTAGPHVVLWSVIGSAGLVCLMRSSPIANGLSPAIREPDHRVMKSLHKAAILGQSNRAKLSTENTLFIVASPILQIAYSAFLSTFKRKRGSILITDVTVWCRQDADFRLPTSDFRPTSNDERSSEASFGLCNENRSDADKKLST